jgi:2,4-dienoyl-CoA reductase-like NADH-dependent reductase (Old Yellow Enzyme family)
MTCGTLSSRVRLIWQQMSTTQQMKLSEEVRIKAAGVRGSVSTVEQAIEMIDNLQPELAQLARWTFARALLVEALKSGKSRDVKIATRQLQQALRDEKWA